ncbi:MAG TPA: LCP family protein [Pseudonocardiaceae bacterium]|nr:LCP family protein [Pseudonocardiaceae bacterium]
MDDWPPRSSGELGGSQVPRGQRPNRGVPPRGGSGGQPRRPRPQGEYSPRQRPTGQPPRRTPPPTRATRAPRRPAPRRKSTSAAGRTTRIALAVVSALILAGTGYGWSTVAGLTNGLTTTDVIDPAAEGTSGPQNILLVGIDTRTDAQGNKLPQNVLDALHAGDASDGADATDTMILIHIPAGGGRAIGFSIPRDSYVDLAGGFGEHKINSAYTYAQVAAAKLLRAKGVTGAQLALQSAQAGAKNTIQTIEQFTGLQINHYASVNLVGFYDISQAIGGVQVCLRRSTHDPDSGANFKAGVQTIEGAKALAFVRQRHGLLLGDLDRIKRQQVFMAAMAHSILSAGVLTSRSKLDRLVSAIQKSITLDKGWNVLEFAQQLQGLSAGAIQFLTVPIVSITYPTQSDGDAVEVDPQQVQSFVQAEVGKADNPRPAGSTKPAAPPPPTTNAPSNGDITTEVYNATGIHGLAGDVLEALTSKGFTSGGTGNSTARTSTVIDYAPGDEAKAQQVATALGGNIRTVSATFMSTGTVRVYLGTSYSGPKGATTNAASSPTSKAAAPPPITAGAANCVD